MSQINGDTLRAALRETHRADETEIVNALIEKARFTPEARQRIFERAKPLVEAATGKPVLTTPDTAVLKLKRLLGA